MKTVPQLAQIIGDLDSTDSSDAIAVATWLDGQLVRLRGPARLALIANTMEAYALLVQRGGLDLRITYPELEIAKKG